MKAKDKLYYLISAYLEGKYTTEAFSEQFTDIYNLEIDYDELSPEEKENFKSLNQIASRYSPFKEDVAKYDSYYDDDQVKNKTLEVKKNLNYEFKT